MIVKKADVLQSCAVCHRSLLLGEKTVRFAPSGQDWVEVCALCTEEAYEHGWVREGNPTSPLVPQGGRRRGRFSSLTSLFESRRPEVEPAGVEPVLRRLSQPEQGMLHAAELFNSSPYRRTVAGIFKSLGAPQVSMLALSGTNMEVVISVAWEISWYQYRVTFGASQPVRLAERGYEIEDLDPRFKQWNAALDETGKVVPDIPRF